MIKRGDFYFKLTKHGKDDFSILITEDIDDTNEGCSERSSEEDIWMICSEYLSLDDVNLLFEKVEDGEKSV